MVSLLFGRMNRIFSSISIRGLVTLSAGDDIRISSFPSPYKLKSRLKSKNKQTNSGTSMVIIVHLEQFSLTEFLNSRHTHVYRAASTTHNQPKFVATNGKVEPAFNISGIVGTYGSTLIVHYPVLEKQETSFGCQLIVLTPRICYVRGNFGAGQRHG